MSAAKDPAAETFRPFSEPMKRKLTIAAVSIAGIALAALFVLAKYHEYRIKRDVGITNSRFADSQKPPAKPEAWDSVNRSKRLIVIVRRSKRR
jgi:hypothetical protein